MEMKRTKTCSSSDAIRCLSVESVRRKRRRSLTVNSMVSAQYDYMETARA